MLNMVSLLLISAPVGFLGALTGLGGASILVPLLILLGIPVKEAIASCMVTIIATSSGSASSYVRKGITNVKVAFYFAGFLSTSFLKLKEKVPRDFAVPEYQDKLSRWLDLHGSYFDEAKSNLI